MDSSTPSTVRVDASGDPVGNAVNDASGNASINAQGWAWETALIALAFAFGLIVRLAALGSLPLNESEAHLALQALALAHGQPTAVDGQPLYLLLTAATFFFGSSEVAARLWSALAGSLVVIVPLLLKPLFHTSRLRMVSVVMAFWLALDPGLVGLSRQAGGAMFAISFLALGLACLLTRRSAAAGVLLGLAILGGSAAWPGLISLGLALWLTGVWREVISPEVRWKQVGQLALVTVLAGGSLFFIFPVGLGALAASLPEYFSGWVQASSVHVGAVWGAMLGEELLPLIFAAVGVALFWKSHLARFAGAWALIALLLASVQPGREMSDLAWALIPLTLLASLTLVRLFTGVGGEDRWLTLGQMGLCLVILTFISMDVLAVVNAQLTGQQAGNEWVAALAAVVLLLISCVLVAWGWSVRVASRGLAWAVTVIAIVFSLGAMGHAANMNGQTQADFWHPQAQFVDADLLRDTLNRLSRAKVGAIHRLDIAVVKVDSDALRWALRGEQKVTYTDALPASASPSVVITGQVKSVELAKSYRGEGFVLAQSPAWLFDSAETALRWLYFRQMGADKQSVILWAQSSLFPGEPAANTTTTP